MTQTSRPRPLAVAALAALMIAFGWTVGGLSVAAYRYYIATWDLSIFTQATWLVAYRQEPYLTTRLMTILSHHLNLLIFPLAAIYRLSPSPITLLWVQVLSVASAAVPLFLIARRTSGSDTVAVIWVLLFLNYPTLQYMTLHDFHFEPLALPFFVWALWFALGERWRPMGVMLAVASLSKENAGLAVACFGLGLMGARQVRVGALTAVLGLTWTVVATKVLMPAFSPAGAAAFYTDMYYGHLGGTMTQVALSPLLRPVTVAQSLWRPANGTLLLGLLVPVAGLALLRPSWLIGGAAVLYLNMVGLFWPPQTIEYHYQGFVIPFVFGAAVAGGGWLGERLSARGVRRPVALAVAPVLALLGTFGLPWWEAQTATTAGRWFAGPPTSPWRQPRQIATWRANRPWAADCDQLIAQIPPDASISASMLLLHHVCERRQAWIFPSPFYPLVEGFGRLEDVTVERLAQGLVAQPVDYVLVQTNPGNPNPLDAVRYQQARRLLSESGCYELIGDVNGVQLYRRTLRP